MYNMHFGIYSGTAYVTYSRYTIEKLYHWRLTNTVLPLVGVNSTLLTVTGFVVSLGLSFRNSSAYERYMEGRKYWAQLIQISQCMARVFWIHAKERSDSIEKDMLAKL